METTYNGHDGMIYAAQFHRWIMSAKGVRNDYFEVSPRLDTNLGYSFQDANIHYHEDGSVRDGSPVSIKIAGSQKEVTNISKALERKFPRLQRLN